MTIPYFLDMTGTVAFAVSGALAGVRKGMDFYGITFLALVTSVGGGAVRDVFVGRVPPFFFSDNNYLIVSVVMSTLVFLFHKHFESKMNIFLIMDALGLGVFTVTGVSVGLTHNAGWVGAVMLGVITGTFGGMFRDILQKEIPLVLQKEIYASASMIGGIFYCVFYNAGLSRSLNFILVTSFVFILRVVSIRRRWRLPVVKVKNL
jgi:uncharacterized membrane protein YeiH